MMSLGVKDDNLQQYMSLANTAFTTNARNPLLRIISAGKRKKQEPFPSYKRLHTGSPLNFIPANISEAPAVHDQGRVPESVEEGIQINVEENITSDNIQGKEGTFAQNVKSSSYDEDITELAKAMGVSQKVFEYTPPCDFSFKIPTKHLDDLFDKQLCKLKSNSYGAIIDRYFNEAQKCCAFIVRNAPAYSKSSDAYVYLYGKCKCGLHFIVTILEQPRKGLDVKCTVETKYMNKFKLIQKTPVGREIRGDARDIVMEELKSSLPAKLFAQRLLKTNPYRALHNNYMQRSLTVLQKISSQAKRSGCTRQDPFEDLRDFQECLVRNDETSKVVKGFVQYIYQKPDECQVRMYNEKSLRLLKLFQKTRQENVVLHIDATGSVVTQSGLSPKKVLLYLVVARSKHFTFPVGETLSQVGRAGDIANMLQSLKDHAKLLDPAMTRMANVIVCDFSFAMIHGALRSLNSMGLKDYLNYCYEIVAGRKQMDPDKTVLFLCSSHLLHSFSRLLNKHLPSYMNKVKYVAKHSFARLQEGDDLQDFVHCSNTIIQIFGQKCMDPQRLNILVQSVITKRSSIEEPEPVDNEILNELLDDFDENFYTTLRESSPFFRLFRMQRSAVSCENSSVPNPYFCEKVIDLVQNFYVPYTPLFSSMILRATRRHTDGRITNAYVENSFNLIKNNFHNRGKTSIEVFVRENFLYHDSQLTKVLHDAQNMPSEKNRKHPTLDPEAEMNAVENWQKRLPYHGVPRYFRSEKSLLNRRPTLNQNHTVPDGSIPENISIPAATAPRPTLQLVTPMTETSGQIGREVEVEQSVLMAPDQYPKHAATLAELPQIKRGGPNYTLNAHDILILCDPSGWLETEHIKYFMEGLMRKYRRRKFQITSPNFVFKGEQHGTLAWWNTRIGNQPMDRTATRTESKIHQDRITLHPLLYTNHWILLAVDRDSRLCTFYNSMHYDSDQQTELENEVRNEVLKQFLPTDTATDTWSFKVAHTAKQSDISSCGIFVLEYAEAILKEKSLDCDVLNFPRNPDEVRLSLAKETLQTTEIGRNILVASNGKKESLVSSVRRYCTTAFLGGYI